MIQSYLPYAITELYCIVFALILLAQLNSSIGSEHEVRLFKCMLYSYIVLLLGDIVYALVEGGLLFMNPLAYAAVNAATIFAISLGCYFWFRFVEDRLHPTFFFSKKYRYLVNAPIILLFVLDLASIFTGFIFFIDQGCHYQETSFFMIQSVINFAYALIPTVNSIVLAMRTHSKLHQWEYASYAVFILAPIIASLLEDVIPTVPILALNIFAVVLILFLTMQNMQIFNDTLTDLNNRRRLDQYLEKRLETASSENPVILFMLDINRFKTINDQYGHISGDNALRTFAAALKMVAGKHGAFIARYGGDEFCLVTNAYPRAPEEVEASLNEALEKAQDIQGTERAPYTISASLGYAICETPGCDADALISEADTMLYENKERWHRENTGV